MSSGQETTLVLAVTEISDGALGTVRNVMYPLSEMGVLDQKRSTEIRFIGYQLIDSNQSCGTAILFCCPRVGKQD